jgi:taurine dioxygenase
MEPASTWSADMMWRPLSPFGAQVELDLAFAHPTGTVQTLRDLFDRHHLLVFDHQHLPGDEQKRVAGWFGPVDEKAPATFLDGLGTGPLSFHSDQTSSPHPFVGLSLHAVDVTDGMTSTVFVDGVMAARTLPPSLLDRVAGRLALHVLPVSIAERVRAPDALERPRAVHPILLEHPRTGETILFVNTRTDRILDLGDEESETLLQELFDHLYSGAHTYAHPWSTGDLLVWDNLSLQHGRPETPTGVRRKLQRVAIGDNPEVSQVPAELIASYIQNR